MLEVYQDVNEELVFAIFVVDERVCKKTVAFIKQNFGYELERIDDEDDFIEIGEFLVDTLMLHTKYFSEDWLELANKIHLHLIP